jgi:phosphoribosylanthranilate isomerase
MLSGGLTAGNLASALSVLSPDAVDVSSGVEETRGVKSPERIRQFIQAAG